MGWINFNVASLKPNDPLARDQQIGVSIHELAHSLGYDFN